MPFLRGKSKRQNGAGRHQRAFTFRQHPVLHDDRPPRHIQHREIRVDLERSPRRDVLLRETEERTRSRLRGLRRRQSVPDGLPRFGDMQLPRASVRADAPPITEAEGRVRTLLHLVKARIVADCVDKSARNEENVARFRLVTHQHVLDRSRPDRLLHVPRTRARLQARVDDAIVQQTPHFRLRFAPRHKTGLLVWMHLHRKTCMRVNDLEQERKIRPHVPQRLAGELPVGNDGRTLGMCRDNPILRSPENLSQIRFESQNVRQHS